MLKRDEDVEM